MEILGLENTSVNFSPPRKARSAYPWFRGLIQIFLFVVFFALFCASVFAEDQQNTGGRIKSSTVQTSPQTTPSISIKPSNTELRFISKLFDKADYKHFYNQNVNPLFKIPDANLEYSDDDSEDDFDSGDL